MNIHSHAIVSPKAKIGCEVEIGPFSIVEADVEIGDGCKIASGVVIKSGTRLGPHNQVFDGAVLGGMPQHVRPPALTGTLEIGAGNTLREYVTLHRALHEGGTTAIGDNNLLMVGTHVAHDCKIGDNAIFANNALLAGHVIVEDRAYVSGSVGLHQFCRIGTLAMVGGHARVVQDVPPYVTVDGGTGLIVGLNLIGLRRNGFTAGEIAELKAAYRVIYRSGTTWAEVLQTLRAQFAQGPASRFHEFLSQGTRGFVQERRMPPSATIKLRRTEVEEEEVSSTAATAAIETPAMRAMAG
jgi:UDP-N-acetylglucosamine acyltransferase